MSIIKEDILLCECGDPSHQLIMYYEYDEEYETPNVYVAVHLTPEKNFFKRLWIGLKYIFFKKRSIYGDFDEIILRPEDAHKLHNAANWLDEQGILNEKIELSELFNKVNKHKNGKIYPIFLDLDNPPS